MTIYEMINHGFTAAPSIRKGGFGLLSLGDTSCYATEAEAAMELPPQEVS
jgi:hypothetical protein